MSKPRKKRAASAAGAATTTEPAPATTAATATEPSTGAATTSEPSTGAAMASEPSTAATSATVASSGTAAASATDTPGGTARAVGGPAALSHPAALAALSALSGCLLFLSCADFDIWILAWIFMVPTMWAAERARTGRQAFLLGWLGGAVANVGGFYWIIGLLERFAHLPRIVAALLFLLLAAYQGLIVALFAWCARSIRRRHDLPMALVGPLVMVTFELAVPLMFPFYVAITQAWQLHVIQVADLTGPLGVTALLLMVNGAVYDLATAGRRRALAAAISLAVLAGALGYGDLRIRQVAKIRAAAPKIQVGVVQPNLAFDEKGDDREAQLADLQERTRELEDAGADLVLWPESSYPYPISRAADRDFPEGHRWRIRDDFEVPLVIGAVTWPVRGDEDRRYPFNSALMVAPDGRFEGRFDKTFLVMFSEYIPGLETFPWLRKVLPQAAGHFARGKVVTTFPLTTRDGRTWRLGPLICYEDIIPAFGRKLAKQRPHLLVNLTNDSWFGDTSEPWQHLALSVFRSVEQRTDLVRAVNTGVSAYIDGAGRVYAKTYAVDPAKDPRPADKILAPVALVEGGHTVYAAIGDLFGYLCAAATAILWIVLPWRARRPKGRARR